MVQGWRATARPDDVAVVSAAQTAAGEHWNCMVYIDGDYFGEETVDIRSSDQSGRMIQVK